MLINDFDIKCESKHLGECRPCQADVKATPNIAVLDSKGSILRLISLVFYIKIYKMTNLH